MSEFSSSCTLARVAAEEGSFDGERRHSLFKGELGLATLARDLERPDRARFPVVA